MEQLKKQVCEAIDRRAAELIEIADWIHAHPEIGHQEVEAANFGVSVNPIGGLDQLRGAPIDRLTSVFLELLHVVCHHQYCCASSATRDV